MGLQQFFLVRLASLGRVLLGEEAGGGRKRLALLALSCLSVSLAGASAIAVFAACVFVPSVPFGASWAAFAVFAVVSFAVLLAACLVVSRVAGQSGGERVRLGQDDAELLRMLRHNRDMVKACMSLMSGEYSHGMVESLFERFDVRSRCNLVANVGGYLRVQSTDIAVICRAFPEFTPSEVSICRLILQGRKQGEICTILNKKESNVNSQRANMRRKLGMRADESLPDKLRERIGGCAAHALHA